MHFSATYKMKMMKQSRIAVVFLFLGTPLWAQSGAPVVVELFESQGCSSCPPAERVLKTVQEEFGAGVIALTFHVDYWDYLGWKDSFSDARWTARQKIYAQFFQQDSIYTPEMVVQGQSGFVGSDLRRARQDVQHAAAAPHFAFTAKVVPDGAGVQLSVQCPAPLASQVHDLIAVRVENAPAVHVLRGENSGVTMSGDNAVRDLIMMPSLTSGQSSMHITISHSPTSRLVVLAIGPQGHILAAQEVR
jgi:hypothetical protein